jgi:hypothetical protein
LASLAPSIFRSGTRVYFTASCASCQI